jgi:hypothetical protein
LRSAVVSWLADFHNAVNSRLGKEVVIGVDYDGCTIAKCEMDLILDSAAFGTKMLWIKMDMWKRWLRAVQQLRLLLGT